MRDKALKFKKVANRALWDGRIARMRERGEDECKIQFIEWAIGTSLEIGGIEDGYPVFRPAICAWEAWKAAWNLRA